MIYILIAPQHAAIFSRGLARLMRPSHLRSPDDVTDFYCSWIVHPSNGWAALVIPETETVPIHLEADGSELLDVLQVFVTDGSLTPQEAEGISQAIFAMRGQQVSIADFVPPSWQAIGAMMTDQQIIDGGWLPNEDV